MRGVQLAFLNKFKESGPLYITINRKSKSNISYKAQRMGQGKIGEIMQSIVDGTSVEESNKRVAGHMPRKTLVNLDIAETNFLLSLDTPT